MQAVAMPPIHITRPALNNLGFQNNGLITKRILAKTYNKCNFLGVAMTTTVAAAVLDFKIFG